MRIEFMDVDSLNKGHYLTALTTRLKAMFKTLGSQRMQTPMGIPQGQH